MTNFAWGIQQGKPPTIEVSARAVVEYKNRIYGFTRKETRATSQRKNIIINKHKWHNNIPNQFLKKAKTDLFFFPIQKDDIWAFYKRAEASFWTAEEIDLAPDLIDWETKLNDNERHFIKHVLAFFAASDGIVNENLAENFVSEVQYTEAKFFYGFSQIAMEKHSSGNLFFVD